MQTGNNGLVEMPTDGYAGGQENTVMSIPSSIRDFQQSLPGGISIRGQEVEDPMICSSSCNITRSPGLSSANRRIIRNVDVFAIASKSSLA
ncbi:hypothetical protein HOY82DRAFT_609950 [Tuber indicum]|nr:hypothetical protein HOY82DRAFT_609950 [Tuber indicum]